MFFGGGQTWPQLISDVPGLFGLWLLTSLIIKKAGTLQIPEKKVAQISKLFGTSNAAILGTPQPFDLFGIDKSIGDDRTYYGEVAIHFKSGGTPLLLPITEAAHGDLFSSLQQDEPFVKVESLDNRMVFVRRDAVSDIFFSSEAYDDYGPEADRYDEVLGIFPDDDFWRIAEVFDFLSDVSSVPTFAHQDVVS